MSERAAMFRASHEVIAQILDLPPGAYIDGIVASQEFPGEVTFRIRGAGFPVELGRAIQYVRPVINDHRNEAGEVTKRTVEWGFPKDEQSRESAGGE